MSVIKSEDVAGVYDGDPHTGQRVFCNECWASKGAEGLNENDIITKHQVENEENLYFCDECGGQLE